MALSFETFNNYLYAGTRNLTTGEVWHTNDGTSLNQVNTNGLGDTNNNSVSALAAFSGYLYASTFRPSGLGTQVWRCQACYKTAIDLHHRLL